METIISAAISAVTTLIVCLLTNKSSDDKTRALLDYRLQQLEHKVDKHNSVVERTFILEGRMTEAEHDIRDLRTGK